VICVITSVDALLVPLHVSSTDLVTGASVCFSTGKLHDVLLGSAAIPGLFNPVTYNKYKLVDGGNLNNLPVNVIGERCDLVIGIHVNKKLIKSEKWFRLQVIERCFHLAIGRNVAKNAAQCDLLIEPDLSAYSVFDTKFAGQLFYIGYSALMMKEEMFVKAVRS